MDLTDTQAEAIRGLREFADFLEANPELTDQIREKTFYLWHHGEDKAEFARKAALMGPVTKSSAGGYFNVEHTFGPLVTLQLTARHEQVCEKVVTGSEVVTVTERDEDAVAEALAQIPVTTVTKTVETFEWVCPPSILALADQAN